MAEALVLLPALAWILIDPVRGFALALIVILALPSWRTLGGRHAYQVGAVLAALAILGGSRLRRTTTDYALFAYLALMVLGWLLQYDQPQTWHIVFTELTPVAFYLGARAVPPSRYRSIMPVILFAGTYGALTVIYEFARGHALYIDPTKYLWNGAPGAIFRPGGIFGSPPGAATVLCGVLFFGLASVRGRHGKMKSLSVICLAICGVALVLTFTRAPLIGAVVGLVLFLWLLRSPLVRPRRVAAFILVAAAALALLLPALEQSSAFKEGILRGGTLSARESYWKLALPIGFASTHNVLVGIGTGVLETPAISPLTPIPSLLAKTPQTFDDSLHNQYVTTFVEQGIVGLAALLFLLAAAFIPAARAARATGEAVYAASAATVAAMAIVFATDTEMLHTPSLVILMVAAGFAARSHEIKRKATAPGVSVGSAK